MSQWQSKTRCRQRVLPLSRAVHPKGKWSQKEVPADQWLGKLIRLEKGSYQTSITDLRMVTNYTVTVDADYHGLGHSSAYSPYSPTSSEQFPVSAETKGCKDLLLFFYSCIPSLIPHPVTGLKLLTNTQHVPVI